MKNRLKTNFKYIFTFIQFNKVKNILMYCFIFTLFFWIFLQLEHWKTSIAIRQIFKAIEQGRESSYALLKYDTCAYIVTIYSIVSILFCAVRKIRIFGFFYVLFISCIFFSYQNVFHQWEIGYYEITTGLKEISFLGDTIVTYKAEILRGIMKSSLFTFALVLFIKFIKFRLRPWHLLSVPIAVIIIYLGMKDNPKKHFSLFLFRIPITVVHSKIYAPYAGKRAEVKLELSGNEKVRNIIFIVDESVRGDCLQINGFYQRNTPYLKSIQNRIINLGIACASANISRNSNLILRSGLTLDQIPDKRQLSLKNSSIYQYAVKSGYKTFYFDAQNPYGLRNNFLNKNDQNFIDVFYHPKGKPEYLKDHYLAKKIVKILQSEKSAFIWVNKKGAHFPYNNQYPPEKKFFQPIMPQGKGLSDCTKKEVLNSYSNSIRWTVDTFFKLLLPEINLSDTVVIYTSDHGQSIKEENQTTHGMKKNPSFTQATVPIFIIGNAAEIFFKNRVQELNDNASHFQIFPSLLILMGYPQAKVKELYGRPLWEKLESSRYFISGDLFGRKEYHINKYHYVPGSALPET